MTSADIAMTQSDLDAEYMERVVSWNVKMLLTAYGKSQTALAEALGIQRAAMSKKIKGVNSWSLSDLVKTARFLDTKTETLMDDSLMRRMGVADTKKAASEEAASDGLLRLGLNQRPSD